MTWTIRIPEDRRARTASIRAFLIDQAADHPRGLVRRAASVFGISRQAVHGHLAPLVREGLLGVEGRTRSRRYRLPLLAETQFEVALDAALAEDVAWRDRAAPLLAGVAPGALEVCQHGLGELLRNAADHSGADRALVRVARDAARIDVTVRDEGRGLLETTVRGGDPRAAALEIVKEVRGRGNLAPPAVPNLAAPGPSRHTSR